MPEGIDGLDAKTLKPVPTENHITRRREALNEIKEELGESYETTPKKELIQLMIKKGYDDYTKDKLYKDELEIIGADSFVYELSVYRYSGILRDIFEKIALIERESKKDFDSNSGFVKVNSKKLYLECQKVKTDILESKAVDISIELMSKKLRKLQQEQREQAQNKTLLD